MKELIKSLNTRDLFTMGFWLIFLMGIITLLLLAPAWVSWILIIVSSMVFGKLMYFRKNVLNYPERDVRCNWGSHRMNCERMEYMSGTGKFIGDQQITEKSHYCRCTCTRPGCGVVKTYWNF